MARVLSPHTQASCNFLDLRFPEGYSLTEASSSFRLIDGSLACNGSEFQPKLANAISQIDTHTKMLFSQRLKRFEEELFRTSHPFIFSDCSIGNLVFAGCFLETGRRFNAAVEDYCSLLNLPGGLIENVTDGTTAYLVAVTHQNQILGSEAEIVDTNTRNRIKDIYLIDCLICPTFT